MAHSTSAPNERVLRGTQLAKLSFNHILSVALADVFQYFCKKMKNVSCEYDRLNGCNSTFLCKLRGTSDTFVYRYGFYKKLKNVSCE